MISKDTHFISPDLVVSLHPRAGDKLERKETPYMLSIFLADSIPVSLRSCQGTQDWFVTWPIEFPKRAFRNSRETDAEILLCSSWKSRVTFFFL